MLYFIVTTSLPENSQTSRKIQYINGIKKLRKQIKKLNIKKYKMIIVENNGNSDTFLNKFGCLNYYTNNNFLKTQNKGVKELKDILDCITHFEIKDTDFIVKMTGRYVLNDDSEFMNVIKDTSCDCVIKYGSYSNPFDCFSCNDCITGLIGMRCKYVKKIEFPIGVDCVEWNWAKATKLIDDKKIHMVDKLGISICPGCDTYFDV